MKICNHFDLGWNLISVMKEININDYSFILECYMFKSNKYEHVDIMIPLLIPQK